MMKTIYADLHIHISTYTGKPVKITGKTLTLHRILEE